MSTYGFAYIPEFVNTWLVLVGQGLTRGKWTSGTLSGLNRLAPGIYLESEFTTSTGDGTKGFLRYWPTPDLTLPVPSSIPDSKTIWISWDIPETGKGSWKIRNPKLYKFSATIKSNILTVYAGGKDGWGTCQPGYVWREAFPGDQVCVLPATRTQVVNDDKKAASRTKPDGSCKAGYVWRQADGPRGISDQVCVLPATRKLAWADNAAAQSREL